MNVICILINLLFPCFLLLTFIDMKAVNELGFLHPTPIQAATIPVALMGKDLCACAATGTGK